MPQILLQWDAQDDGRIHQVWKIWILEEGYDGRREQWEDYWRRSLETILGRKEVADSKRFEKKLNSTPRYYAIQNGL